MHLRTLLPARRLAVSANFEALVVYLRLRTVSMTLTSKVLDVLDVLDVVAGGGGGSAIPVVGMLPANIEVDSAHISTTAITSFFMVFLAPLRFEKILRFLHKKEREQNEVACKVSCLGSRKRITIGLPFINTRFRKVQFSCERPLRSWIPLTLLRMKKLTSESAQH